MIKDIFFSPNGKKSQRQLQEEMMTLTESVKILPISWTQSIKINKFSMKEKDNSILKKDLIEKNKLRMSLAIEILVTEKIN